MFDADLGDRTDRLFTCPSSSLSRYGQPDILESVGAKVVGHFSLEHGSQGEGWREIMKKAINRIETKALFLGIHSLA
jgi:hypothetical protein